MDEVNWKKKMSPGTKNMELRKHFAEISKFCEENGEEATCEKYHMRPDTLTRLLAHEPWGSKKPKFSHDDRNEMMASMALEGLGEVRRQVRELKEAWAVFVETVGEQLAVKFFLPLLRNKIELPPELDTKEDTSLLLADMAGMKAPRLPAGNVIDQAEQVVEAYTEPKTIAQLEELAQRREKVWFDLGNAVDDARKEAKSAEDWQFAYGLLLQLFKAPHSRLSVETFKKWQAWVSESENIFVTE